MASPTRRKNLTALLFPYVMEMAEQWEALDEREKEAVQSAVENDMEEQRAHFEQMFM